MNKVRSATVTIALSAGLFAGAVPAANASSGYTLERTGMAISGNCRLYVDILLNNTDHHEYQQGHAASANGDLCYYTMVWDWTGGWDSSWNGQTTGATIWSPVLYDGPGYSMHGVISDMTTGSTPGQTETN